METSPNEKAAPENPPGQNRASAKGTAPPSGGETVTGKQGKHRVAKDLGKWV